MLTGAGAAGAGGNPLAGAPNVAWAYLPDWMARNGYAWMDTDRTSPAVAAGDIVRSARWPYNVTLDYTSPALGSSPTLYAESDGKLSSSVDGTNDRLLFPDQTYAGDWCVWWVGIGPAGNCVPVGRDTGAGNDAFVSWDVTAGNLRPNNNSNSGPNIAIGARSANVRTGCLARRAGNVVYAQRAGSAEVNGGSPSLLNSYTFGALGWLGAGFGSGAGLRTLATIFAVNPTATDFTAVSAYLTATFGVTF
jgi:hypothetical protein